MSSTGKMDQAMIDALLAGAEPEPEVEPALSMDMGKMDQSMIDALLAGADNNITENLVDNIAEVPEEKTLIESLDDLGPEFLDQFVTLDDSDFEILPETASESVEDLEANLPKDDDIQAFDTAEDLEKFLLSEETMGDAEMNDATSALAQLMAEMQEESLDDTFDGFNEADFMTEDSIEALLSAAKSTSNEAFDETPISFGASNDDEISEIEALLGMSDNAQILDENSELLRMIEEASEGIVSTLDAELEEAVKEVDEAELDAILSQGSGTDSKDQINDKSKKEGKEKKPFSFKEFRCAGTGSGFSGRRW